MCCLRFRVVVLCFMGVLTTSCEKSDSPVDAALAQSMTKMHSAMQDVPLVGKPDADFALMMIPHHQGAIEMAKVELQFGADPNLRRLAQEIIVTQQSDRGLRSSRPPYYGSSRCKPADAPTTVTVNNQGLMDLLQAAVTGLPPKTNYQLALAEHRSKPYGKLEPIVAFTTNPAGAAILDTLGPLRHFVAGPADESDRRYLVIVPGSGSADSEPVQIQLE